MYARTSFVILVAVLCVGARAADPLPRAKAESVGMNSERLGLIATALKAIKYKGDVVIESFTTDVKVIARAAAIWRRIEPTRDEIAVKGIRFFKKALR